MSKTAVFALGLAMGLFWGASAYRYFWGSEPWQRRYESVRQFVAEDFVRPVADQRLDDAALAGMLQGLDPYSRFYDQAETAELERETGGRYRGVGIVLKRPITEGRVLFPLAGGPAERAGVRVGDRLLAIDGQRFAGLDDAGVRALLASTSDQAARIELEGLDGTRRSLEVERESVVEPSVRREELVDATHGVGYLAISSFSHETAAEFDAAFERLRRQGMRALVIDVRGNGGGVLLGAVAIARRFIPEGTIVSTEGRRTSKVHAADAALALHAGFPLAVLVDDESASASEVLAAALQDHRAAVVVGVPTWGKGTVQAVRTFGEHGVAAKVTTSFYFTPSHRNLEHGEAVDFGIAPDVLVEPDETEALRLRVWLARQAPPPERLAELRAWEQREKVQLVEPRPRDRALAAALALFAGRRPDGSAQAGPDGSAPARDGEVPR